MELLAIDALWDYDSPQATALKFRELLPTAERSVDKTYYAELLTQLARTQSLQRNFDEAHSVLDAARQVMEGQNMPVPEIRYLLERGRTFNSAGEKEQSISLFKGAYAKAVEHNEDFYAIDAAHMLGIAAKPQDQLFWNIEAMGLAEKTADTRARKWLGSLYNNIGWTYHDLKDYVGALTFFEKLLAWRIDQKDERGAFIANWSVARTYRSLDRIAEALALQRGLLDEIQRKGLDPSGYVFEELAECLLLQGRGIEARAYFKKAYEILSKDIWLKANEADRLERLKDLGEQVL
jgi:tetratricopeptide (TPR) repeat protein